MKNKIAMLVVLLNIFLHASEIPKQKVSPYVEQEKELFKQHIALCDGAYKACGAMALIALVTSIAPSAVSCPVCALHIGCACAGACAAVHLEDAKIRAENRLRGDVSFATDAIGKWIDGCLGLDKQKQQ